MRSNAVTCDVLDFNWVAVMTAASQCIFCDYADTERHKIVAENELAYVHYDKFPVSDGHCEVIPKAHIVSYFDLTVSHLAAMHELTKEVAERWEEEYCPDGYTLGVNEGEAAGRSVHHVHFHIIPRYLGDVESPRGGIRHIIPGKGNY